MACLKMYMLSPKAKGIPCPEGCSVVRYKGEEDIPAWVEICSDGENNLCKPGSEGRERFINELTRLDGPDPLRDTYFVEYNGEKVATFTAVPNMWSTGMGYIHMVSCKQKCRGMGIGKFISDYAVKLLCDIGKERLFLLSNESHIAALSLYIKEGFTPADDGRTPEESAEQKKRWQTVIETLGIESIDFLNFDGSYCTTLRAAQAK